VIGRGDKIPPLRADQVYVFILDYNANLVIDSKFSDGPGERFEVSHKALAAKLKTVSGKELKIVAAGEIYLSEDGVLVVNNRSGTFRFDAETLTRVKHRLIYGRTATEGRILLQEFSGASMDARTVAPNKFFDREHTMAYIATLGLDGFEAVLRARDPNKALNEALVNQLRRVSGTSGTSHFDKLQAIRERFRQVLPNERVPENLIRDLKQVLHFAELHFETDRDYVMFKLKNNQLVPFSEDAISLTTNKSKWVDIGILTSPLGAKERDIESVKVFINPDSKSLQNLAGGFGVGRVQQNQLLDIHHMHMQTILRVIVGESRIAHSIGGHFFRIDYHPENRSIIFFNHRGAGSPDNVQRIEY
jgi:hypothetical protein